MFSNYTMSKQDNARLRWCWRMRQRPAIVDQVCRKQTSGIAALDARKPHPPESAHDRNLHEILYFLVMPVTTLHMKYPITYWFLFCPEIDVISKVWGCKVFLQTK